MTLQVNLSGTVNNDLLFEGQVTYNGAPLNLTGYTVTAYVKPSKTSLDSAGQTFAVTVTNALLGKISWAIPHVDNTDAAIQWYRIDVASGGDVGSAFVGLFTINPA